MAGKALLRRLAAARRHGEHAGAIVISARGPASTITGVNPMPRVMHCDRLFFATAAHVPLDIFPADAGLILADGYGAELVREAPAHRLHASTRKSVMLAFARAAAVRPQALADPQGPYGSEI